MKVTDVRVTKLDNPKSNLVGFASVTINDVLVLKDLRIVKGRSGLFVAMPAKRDPVDTNKYHNKILILGATQKGSPGFDFSNHLQAAVIKAFKAADGTQPTSKPVTNQGPSSQYDDDVPF